MANKNTITNDLKVNATNLMYYQPISVLPTANTVALGTIYCCLGRVSPWPDDNDPTLPTTDSRTIKQTLNNIFVAKKISASDISPVVHRIDWTANTTYDYYRDDVEIAALDANDVPHYRFYVKNRYDQVFKCLWNANGANTTNEPVFSPGNFDSSGVYTGSDGYKWRYIYTIDAGTKDRFMDSTWMPVPAQDRTFGINSYGAGAVEAINVTSGGSGYDTANAPVYVTVTGDGTGATGTATVSGGAVTDVIVTNVGANYTYANVSITSAQGSGANAIAPISPIGGHSYDPVTELGCSHVMITCEFAGLENGTEGIMVPGDISYRQVSLILNPTATDSTPYPANSSIYKTTIELKVASGADVFSSGDQVSQGSAFTGTVLSFDTGNNMVKLINTSGTPANNTTLTSQSGKSRTVLYSYFPKLQVFSGKLLYVENRTGVQRSNDGIEQLRFVLGY